MIDLRKSTDKELHDEHIETLIRENTDPDIIHAKHIEKLRKDFEESQIQKALLQDIRDSSDENTL
jgi:hypothetical protein